ncbi:unnamed protein product [Calypogeia fissa]
MAATPAASPWRAGFGEICCRQHPFPGRNANGRNISAIQGFSPISASHGCPPIQAMAASPWAAGVGENRSQLQPVLNRNVDCGISSIFLGCSPISSSNGCLPVTFINGQGRHGGVLKPRQRSSTLFVGGGVPRVLGQNTFLGRRKMDIIRTRAEKKDGGISFGDQLLDYIEGGPKLRKWYGAPDQLPKDGGSKKEPQPQKPAEGEDEDDEDLVRDVVLVTDAESATGQLVVLELILRRLRVRALVKDIKAATVGFGAYVEPVEGDVNDKEILKRVMRGVRAVICPTKVGKLADRELMKGVEHIVLLSKLAANRNQGGLGALFGGVSRRDAEENEAAIASLGIPYTIVRAGSLKDVEGGQLGFRYGQDGDVQGSISREDAAYVCAEALDSPPQRALVFEVANGREEVEDWSAVFTSMKETTSASGS